MGIAGVQILESILHGCLYQQVSLMLGGILEKLDCLSTWYHDEIDFQRWSSLVARNLGKMQIGMAIGSDPVGYGIIYIQTQIFYPYPTRSEPRKIIN